MERNTASVDLVLMLKCNICDRPSVLNKLASDFVVPAPHVDYSYVFTCESCTKENHATFEHKNKTWLELVATATYNTARLCSSPYVKVSDIVMYLETHQDKLNLNLSRVDKNVFRQRVNVTLCRNPKLFETAVKGSGKYKLNDKYHRTNKRVFSLLSDQAVVPQQEHVVFDNNSFESLENFLMRDEMEFIKEEDAAIPESSPLMNSEELMHTNSLNILEFLNANQLHYTHPPMVITNNNIIFPRQNEFPVLDLNYNNGMADLDSNKELLDTMLQVSHSDREALDLSGQLMPDIQKDNYSMHTMNSPPQNRVSLVEFHAIVCEKCEQPMQNNEKYLKENMILLPGPQDKNYVYTCGSCTSDGAPSMLHKIKNRLEFTSSVLYTLQQSLGQTIFNMKDVAEKHSYLLKTNAKSLRNVVRAALSDYRNLFQSFGHGLWGFCVDAAATEELTQRRNMPKPKNDKVSFVMEANQKRRRVTKEMLLSPNQWVVPISPEMNLPAPEVEGIFLCWEGDSHFSGFVFALPHQTLAFLRHEITAYDILGSNTSFSFVFQDAPLSELQEESILLMNCVIMIKGRPAMITRRV